MPRRSRRSAHQKQRDQERFWRDNADKVRVVVIGAAAVILVTLLAQAVLT